MFLPSPSISFLLVSYPPYQKQRDWRRAKRYSGFITKSGHSPSLLWILSPYKMTLKFFLSRGRIYVPALETGLALLLTMEVIMCQVWAQGSGAPVGFRSSLASLPRPCEVAQASLLEGEKPHRVELRIPANCRHIRSHVSWWPRWTDGLSQARDSWATINAYCCTPLKLCGCVLGSPAVALDV